MKPLSKINKLTTISQEETYKSLMENFFAGKSPNTIQAYRDDLELFREFLKLDHIEDIPCAMFTLDGGSANLLVLSFKNHLDALGRKPSTISRKIAAIRSLVKLARLFGLITWSIEIQNDKVKPYKDTKGPGKSNFEKMLNVVSGDDSKSVRDYAMLRLLYDLGLRVSEVVNLDIGDYSRSEKTLKVLGKGKKDKVTLHLPEATCSAIDNWLRLQSSVTEALFHSLTNSCEPKRITRTGIYRIVRSIGEKVGIITRPHGIRHLSITEACKLAQAVGLPLEEVLDHSRHANVSTLMIYRDRNEDKQEFIAELLSKSCKKGG
ncbi:MAG: tyrosine-type recombinase/integrase [Bdellovibrionales bacterium]|nr:tyrosine-type recombinase/integrase [Bdellovibrionales bacterium]